MTIDGELRYASSGASFKNINPATELCIGVVADGTAADMDAAISAARKAFDHTDWSTNRELRVRCLRQLSESLQRHKDELRELVIAEVGSPRSFTYSAQLDEPLRSLAWVANLTESYEFETDLGRAEPLGMPSLRRLHREAVGVVGAITPWNVPLQIILAKVGPALGAGNSVVLKPAPDTPWTATVLGRLVTEETDIPAGIFNVVTSSDHQLGAMLSNDPRVDLISFTGSTATGRKVMRDSSETLKRTFLELGGKSAFVVLQDADLKAAVGTAAFMICTHAGQGCAITTRLVVPRAQFDEAVEIAASTMAILPAADPQDPRTICGPLINARQRDRVQSYIDLAIAEGGHAVTGGGRPADLSLGFFIEPTLLVGVPNSSRVNQEEIFGPVLTVIPHDGDEDAVSIANDSTYGLSGAVWSEDLDRAGRVANAIRTGTVSINGGLWYAPDVPFGGYRQSGIGREMGVAGFEEYLETKAIAEPTI
ncbi:MAG: aldehyde dehydrogenase [Actinomycetes bacterium]